MFYLKTLTFLLVELEFVDEFYLLYQTNFFKLEDLLD